MFLLNYLHYISVNGVKGAILASSGGEITSTFDHPELVKLGHCKLIEEVMIGEDTLIHFAGVAMGIIKIVHRQLSVEAAFRVLWSERFRTA